MTPSILGMDIAKSKFDACLLLASGLLRHKVFSNTHQGCVHLTQWLAEQQVEQVHACLEATGTYGAVLALYLYDHAHVVSIVNPAATKAFAASQLRRSKPDRVDAS